MAKTWPCRIRQHQVSIGRPSWFTWGVYLVVQGEASGQRLQALPKLLPDHFRNCALVIPDPRKRDPNVTQRWLRGDSNVPST